MEMFAILAWVLFVFLVVGGVVVNVGMFYLRNAFKAGRLGRSQHMSTVTLSREAVDRDFSMSVGGTGTKMDSYLLKAMVLVLGALFAGGFLLVLLMSRY